jgi:hypothetical protein
MAKTILAVAVGETPRELSLNSANPDFSTVRPYIKGLVSWLKKPNQNRDDPPPPDNAPPQYQIPGEYSIVYRERPIAGLADAFQDATALGADLWFCMSTSVARKADAVAKAQGLLKPIVAIVSDPFSETFGNNVCGVSADRDRLAIRCYKQFRKRISGVKNVFALHRSGYSPSEKARQWVGKNVTLVPVADDEDIQAKIQSVINASTLPKKGVLVLPADRFFGVADLITQWTGTIPTFWSARDFPANASGGYGYEQGLCGQFMAERVANIWKNQADGVSNPIPDPKWVVIDQEYLTGRPDLPARKKKSARPSKRRTGPKK